MLTDDQFAAFYAAYDAKLTIYDSLLPCKLCGTDVRYVNGRQCVECASRRRHARKVEAQRAKQGLKPLKATQKRLTFNQGRASDAIRRAAALQANQPFYASTLPCKHGHHPTDRYTSSGGCVTCAKHSAAKRYIAR